jgi:hypothetical protein
MPFKKLDDSSAIDRIAYDDGPQALSVWFKGGRRYIYSGVPRALYNELCQASSAGGFVNRAIKGRFPCRAEPPRRYYPA